MLLTILFGIIGFGIIVFVHELGHFIAAKASGIDVEVLSLGWGKRLVGFQRKGTWYQLSWFPVGGYCKMKGEESTKVALASDSESLPQEKGSFYGVPPWKRILVSVSGPLANVLFAVVVLTIIYWAGFAVYSDRNRVILVSDYAFDSEPQPSAAERAGLATGDRVVAIDGEPVVSFQDILEVVATSPQERLLFTVERADRTLSLPVVPELNRETGAGRIGVYSWTDPTIDRVTPGKSASIAGLEPDDRIVSIDDTPVDHTIDFYYALRERPSEVSIEYLRSDRRNTAHMIVQYTEEGAPDLGITFRQYAFSSPELGLPMAFVSASRETIETVMLTLKGIGLLFRGVNVGRAVAGPLRITYYVGASATSGLARGIGAGAVSFFRFLCLLSVVIFLMNLLVPIPALDGPRIVLFLVEWVRGVPVRPKIVYRIQLFSFYVLIVLVVVVTLNDIFLLFQG